MGAHVLLQSFLAGEMFATVINLTGEFLAANFVVDTLILIH